MAKNIGFKDRATALKVKALLGNVPRHSATGELSLTEGQAALHRSESAVLAYTLADIPKALMRPEDDPDYPGQFIISSGMCELYALMRTDGGPVRGTWEDKGEEEDDDEKFLRLTPLYRVSGNYGRIKIRQRVYNIGPSDVWNRKLVVIDRLRDGIWYVLYESCVRMAPLELE